MVGETVTRTVGRLGMVGRDSNKDSMKTWYGR